MRTTFLAGFSLAASLCVTARATAQHAGTPAGHHGMQMPGDSARNTARDTALLTGPLGTRSPTGTVTREGRRIKVALTGDEPGSTRLWYVHRGSCARDEGIVGAPSAYAPIAVDARGTGTGSVTLDAPLAEGGAFYVSIHTSATDPTSDVIACGPLMTAARRMRQPNAHEMGNMPMGNMPMGNMPMGNMPGMGHSDMGTPGMAMPGMAGMDSAAGADSASALVMAIHARMMADPVIRERAMTDPVLRRMMARMPAGLRETMSTGTARANAASSARPTRTPPRASQTGGEMSHEGMSREGRGVSAQPRRPAASEKPGAKRAAPENRPAADPHAGHQAPPGARPATTKPAPKPAAAKKDSMPGMDHSKMPGMGKP